MSSEAGGRSRRALSRDAKKKFEALEKLRSINKAGVKNRYESVEEDRIYEEVDEESYAQLVSKRQREDWIVDDDGSGYAEHGREIFDDEYDDLENEEENGDHLKTSKKQYEQRNKYKLMSSKSLRNNNDDDDSSNNGKKDIRRMFNSMINKKSTTTLKLSPMSSSLQFGQRTKELNEVKINNLEIENLVDSITMASSKTTSSSSSLISSGNSFQPLKLQKKLGSSSSLTKKRKTFDQPSLTTTSKILSSKELPPFKRRNNNLSTEFNFDDIICQDEVKKTQPANNQKQINSSVLIKQEPLDVNNDINHDDDMLPVNIFDDEDLSDATTKASVKTVSNTRIQEASLKVEKFSDEEWIVSKNNFQPDSEHDLHEPTKPVNIQHFFSKEIKFDIDQEGNKFLKFYWFDAFHDPSSHHHSDRLFLFGKVYVEQVKQFLSCCLQVKNLERRIFLLPRKHFSDDHARCVQIEDVRREFETEIAPQLKLRHFRSRKVLKKYAFELNNIPEEAEYLEVLYPASYPTLPPRFHQGNTYCHVFGSHASILENFILDLNLMGPGWLVVQNAEVTDPPISWCKLELTVTNPKQQVSVLTETTMQPPPTPDFTILSLCFKTFVHLETKSPEIVAVSCIVNRRFNFDGSNFAKDSSSMQARKFDQHFCIITKLGGRNGQDLPIDFNTKMALKDYHKTRIDVMNNERELLMFFMAKFQQIDPDIIVGHDLYQFDYDILLQRFGHYKIPLQWSKLGRLKCSGLPIRSKDKHLLAGRLICDVKIMSRELLTRSTSYDLTELASQILRKGRFEIEPNLLPQYYQTSSKLIRLVEFLMKDNDLILSIAYELNCLQLCKQITNIAGNLLSRTLLGGRSERNEYLLLHAFYRRGYIVPDKFIPSNSYSNTKNIDIKEEIIDEMGTDHQKTTSGSSTNKKSSYTGGLVLEPKIGFYDRYILLMDFNSLYPSIIQEYNICFTTVGRSLKLSPDKENVFELPNSENPGQIRLSEEGVLPIEIRKLVESRLEVKRSLFDPMLPAEQRGQLDIKQKALKITANSMYGCLGYFRSRFYAKHLAAMVTQKGREILLSTKELVEKMGYDVIYGDTDSIMILTDCLKYEDVHEIGRKIQTEVNRLYTRLEIDIDGVFRCMLLLKKKKYAALSVTRSPKNKTSELQYQREIKGLDIIRRDWSVVAKMAGEEILDIILQPDQTSDVIADQIHQYLKQLAEKIRCNELELESFVINKALAKKPEDYGEQGKNLTHVMVALRYNQKNLGKKLVAGDTVPFVICVDGTQNSATQRGYHLDEVRQQLSEKKPLETSDQSEKPKFRIDINYYLSQQLFPVVSRLCDPLDGTDSVIIAEFLGVNCQKRNLDNHKTSGQEQLRQDDPVLVTSAGDLRFDCCHSLMIRCPYESCSKILEIRDLFRLWNTRNKVSLDPKELKNYSAEILFDLTLGRCEYCNRMFHPRYSEFYFELELRRQLNQHIEKFCQRWMVCDDYVCMHRTRYLSGLTNQKHIICPRCHNGNLQLEISEHFIYQQLTFLHHIFDFDSALQRFQLLDLPDQFQWNARRNALKQKYGDLFRRLQLTVQYFLDQSSYNEFDLGLLFRKFRYNTTLTAGSQQTQMEQNFKK